MSDHWSESEDGRVLTHRVYARHGEFFESRLDRHTGQVTISQGVARQKTPIETFELNAPFDWSRLYQLRDSIIRDNPHLFEIVEKPLPWASRCSTPDSVERRYKQAQLDELFRREEERQKEQERIEEAQRKAEQERLRREHEEQERLAQEQARLEQERQARANQWLSDAFGTEW